MSLSWCLQHIVSYSKLQQNHCMTYHATAAEHDEKSFNGTSLSHNPVETYKVDDAKDILKAWKEHSKDDTKICFVLQTKSNAIHVFSTCIQKYKNKQLLILQH